MSRVITSPSLQAAKIVEAFGLDPHTLRSFRLTIPSNGPALILVEMYVDAEKFNLPVFKRFELRKIE
jgi:hypothetical protein